jgi:DNA sulfur modification protein DndD
MNGHGKTSFLVALYLGLFGRFGLRYCEGFGNEELSDTHYKEAIHRFRRNTADKDDPTSIELIFSPTLNDTEGEEEIIITRRWFFTGTNHLRQNDYESVELRREGVLSASTILTTLENG